MLSFVIPTYNEKNNIERLIPSVFSVLSKNKIDAEVIIVDDNSPDGTSEAVLKLGSKYNVKLIRRAGKLGLSSAVVEGFSMAKGDSIGVMDADFSHPVELLPKMYWFLKTHDMVVASRYVKGGGIENWPLRRRLISKAATLLARPVTRLNDPMSGYFMIRRSLLDGVKLNPRGYKIGLEICAKTRPRRIREVPFTFKDRASGESKMDKKEIMNYLLHVLGLYWSRVKN